jgi:hypothetical protein
VNATSTVRPPALRVGAEYTQGYVFTAQRGGSLTLLFRPGQDVSASMHIGENNSVKIVAYVVGDLPPKLSAYNFNDKASHIKSIRKGGSERRGLPKLIQ